MSFDRIALERALRAEGHAGLLQTHATHNVRLVTGVEETYGRADWIRLETARYAALGPQSVLSPAAIEMPLAAGVTAIAARWRLGADEDARAAACLTLVREGRIVREWQVADRQGATGAVTFPEVLPRNGIPWEYGEVRAAPGQLAPGDDASAVAPRAIAHHPVVLHWHRLWNVDGGAGGELLVPLAEPVMFCERVVGEAGAEQVALQWRLVGRHAADAWGVPASRARVEIPGISFFRLEGTRIADRIDHYDRSVLARQVARCAAC